MNVRRLRGGVCPDIDRFQRDKNDPSVIVFREIKRCQRPHSTQFFQKAKPRKVAAIEAQKQRLLSAAQVENDRLRQLAADAEAARALPAREAYGYVASLHPVSPSEVSKEANEFFNVEHE